MKNYEISRFGVWSVTKVSALLGFAMGLLAGGFVFLMSFAVPPPPSEGVPQAALFMNQMMFGKYSMITLPIFYTLSSALMGALSAVVYNVVAAWVGGLRFSTSASETGRAGEQ